MKFSLMHEKCDRITQTNARSDVLPGEQCRNARCGLRSGAKANSSGARMKCKRPKNRRCEARNPTAEVLLGAHFVRSDVFVGGIA
jgi:hypothetical protein